MSMALIANHRSVIVACGVGVVYLFALTYAWAGPAGHTVEVAPFERIFISGNARVRLTQAPRQPGQDATLQGQHTHVRLTSADPGLLRSADLSAALLESADGALYIDTRHVTNDALLEVAVCVEELKEVVIAGAGRVTADRLRAANLVLEGTGSGLFDLHALDLQHLVVVGAGETSFQLSGYAKNQHVELDGVGHYSAHGLHSTFSQVRVHGSSLVDVWAEELLAIDINGFGDVRYNGSPHVLQQISGRGGVRRASSTPVLRL